MPDNPELSQERLVKPVIKVKHNNDSLMNNLLLINYVLTDTNKQLLISESHSDSNRYKPYRGNPTNMPHTFHDQSAYDPKPYVSHTVNTS
jgi:hypothetical protein